jgi:hypothetical protein
MKKYTDAELYAMPFEQLRQLAEEEAAELQAAADKEAAGEPPVTEEPGEQPRGADGKFVKKEEAEPPATEPETPENEPPANEPPETPEPPANEPPADEDVEYLDTQRIDLGDGSGVQVFVGRGSSELEAAKDLNRQLVQAQENATRKIREQAQQIADQKKADSQSAADQDFVDSEEYKKDPRGYLTRKIREGVSTAIAEQTASEKRHLQAQFDFVALHPEYVTDKVNADRLEHEFRRLYPDATEFTVTGLDKAFESLQRDGLLKLKEPEASEPTNTEPPTKVAEPPRIEEPTKPAEPPAAPVRSPKKGSTVSTGRSPAPVVKVGHSEDEMYQMSMDKLLDLANRQLAANR